MKIIASDPGDEQQEAHIYSGKPERVYDTRRAAPYVGDKVECTARTILTERNRFGFDEPDLVFDAIVVGRRDSNINDSYNLFIVEDETGIRWRFARENIKVYERSEAFEEAWKTYLKAARKLCECTYDIEVGNKYGKQCNMACLGTSKLAAKKKELNL